MNQITSDISVPEIINSRIVNAPREMVFSAWMEADHLKRWWGPKGFTNTFHEFDPRPGGYWRFIMHGPGGTNFDNESRFVEITPSERITFDHLSRPNFRITVSFEAMGETTRLTWRMAFKTPEDYDMVKDYAFKGNEQNLDKLEIELQRMMTM